MYIHIRRYALYGTLSGSSDWRLYVMYIYSICVHICLLTFVCLKSPISCWFEFRFLTERVEKLSNLGTWPTVFSTWQFRNYCPSEHF